MWGDWWIQISVRACLVNSRICVNVAAVQETHFTCAADCWVLEDDYVVLSAYGSRSCVGVSLLIGRNADVNLILADDGGRLAVVYVVVKSFEFRVAPIYAANIAAESVSFFRQLAPFLDNSKWIILVGNWNARLFVLCQYQILSGQSVS